jgi:hypothetical protein
MLGKECGHEVVDKRQKVTTTLDNELIDREDISIYAKGVYMVLARHEGKDHTSWPSTETISKKAGIHHTTVEKAIKELESLNIVAVQRRRGAANRYVLLDKSCWKTTLPDSVVSEESTLPDSVVKDQSTPRGSVVEKPSTLPDSVVHGKSTPRGSVEGFKSIKNTQTLADPGEAFARFWAAAPSQMRKAKLDAQKAWGQLKPTPELVERIIAALEVQKKSDLWRRGVGIPYAASWLRGRRWEDEEETGQPGNNDQVKDKRAAAPEPLEITRDGRGRRCIKRQREDEEPPLLKDVAVVASGSAMSLEDNERRRANQ